METILGKVDRIVYEAPDGDFKIFIIKRKDHSKFTVSGEFSTLLPDAQIEVHGNFKSHPKYGLGFKSESHSFSHDKTPQGLYLYLQSIAKWIGPERSKAIVEHFKEDNLEDIIENNPDRLLEIEGIGKGIAEFLVESWKENKNLKEVKIFLHNLGLSTRKINKIVEKYSYNAEIVIKANPYLLSFEGFGFSTCDFMAEKLGKSAQDPQRYRYFILYSLKNCLQSGHLFLKPAELLLLFNEYNKITNFPFSTPNVTIEEIKPHLDKLVEDGFIYKDGDVYYELQSFFFENESARIIKEILNKPDTCKLENFDTKSFIDEYETKQPKDKEGKEFNFSEEQKDAIESFVKEKIMIITGSPGTGKTSTQKAIVELMQKNNISFELLTPTGIAAKKLGNTAGVEAYTIHRRLGYRGEEWQYNTLNKYSTQAIICDETSMLDMEVFYRLVSALNYSTKFIFVGDKDQLPSVGPGNVLKELIESNKIKVIRLEKIFRQAEQSDIIKAAKKIRDGDTDLSLFKNDPKADIWFIREKDTNKIEKRIVDFAKQIKDLNKTKKDKTHFQIITPRNDSVCSVSTLNTALQDILNPPGIEKEIHLLNNCIIRRGDRVLIKKNNYQLDVYNGDVGKVTLITSDSIIIEVEDFSGFKTVEMPTKMVEDHIKLGYILSIHKCLPINNRIITPNGIIPLKKLKVGDSVVSGNNNSKNILWHEDTGVNKVVRIKTRCGYEIYSSPDHEFLISNETTSYEKAENIKIGDYAHIYREPIKGTRTPLTFKNIRSKKRTLIKLPQFINKEISWMLGEIIGDGCYTDKKEGMVQLTEPENPNLLDKFEKLMIKIGLNVSTRRRNKVDAYDKIIHSKNFRDWLYSIGLDHVKCYDKSIPELIFKTTMSNRIAFLGGLIDSDGCIDDGPQMRYTTTSYKLAQDIHLLLLSLGIISVVNTQKCIKDRTKHQVVISGIDYKIFKKIINLNNIKRNLRLKKHDSSNKNKTNLYEIPYKNNYVEEFITAYRNHDDKPFRSVPYKSMKGKGMSIKYRPLSKALNYILNGRCKLRYPILWEMERIAKIEGFKLPQNIKEVIDKNIFFDEIVEVEVLNREEPMQDIEVEEDHSYISEGFICHNSQGLEYPLIIIPIVKAHGARILQRNLLYTAITRAKKKVIVIGQASAIIQAIKNDKIQRRNTLFSKRIQDWIDGKGQRISEIYRRPDDYQNTRILKKLIELEKSA